MLSQKLLCVIEKNMSMNCPVHGDETGFVDTFMTNLLNQSVMSSLWWERKIQGVRVRLNTGLADSDSGDYNHWLSKSLASTPMLIFFFFPSFHFLMNTSNLRIDVRITDRR